jgi:hypothetical protein
VQQQSPKENRPTSRVIRLTRRSLTGVTIRLNRLTEPPVGTEAMTDFLDQHALVARQLPQKRHITR